jgi:signal transduction histidine kinase/ligand-binding sensor domain-containing protein
MAAGQVRFERDFRWFHLHPWSVKYLNGLSRTLFLCFCLCAGATVTSAQYRLDQWTADNGLPQNSVYSITQTRDGYLWLATVDGLARFDGVRFTIFNKSNSPGIINNRFISLFEASNGDLWAGTEESGAARFHGRTFEHFRADSGFPPSVVWIEPDSVGDGTVFHAFDQTVRFADGKASPFEPLSNPAIDRSSHVKILCRPDRTKQFSECFVNGRWQSFSISDGSSSDKYLSVIQEANADGSPHVRFVSAAQEADGTVWLITADGRLARAENGRVTRIYDERDGLPKYLSYFMIGGRLGLVAKSVEDELWLVDLPSMQKELLFKRDAGALPLEKLEFLSTYADREGNLWFGTKRDGLYRARKQVITTYSEAAGIKDKTVYPVYQDRAGTIWIGAGEGLYKLENDKFVFVESTRTFLVNAITEDDAGRIVISNFGSLYRQGDDGEFVPFEPEKIPTDGFIFAIHSDRENATWVGANELRRLKNGVVTSFSIADGLAGNDVKTIIEARTGGLWIGTYGGLSRFENGRLTSWREEDGLPSRTVRSLYEDEDGALWIGSYDGGLARFKDGKFTRYNMTTGLPNDGAFQILEDEGRNFWISSNRGIYRVSKDELNDFADGKISSVTSTAYGKSDGMLNPECNGGRSPAGVRAHDGRLWFPTQDGIAVIDPDEMKVNSQPPPVVIENVKIDNVDVGFGISDAGSDDEDKSAIPNPNSQIEIGPAQQNFEINYTALSFINSENLRFKYQLEGLDDKWIDASTRRQAYFSHVPPGEYTFRVIAANSDNVWNETGAALRIVVLPAFYRTWWFSLAAALAVVAFVVFLFRLRMRQLGLKHAVELAFSRRLIDSQEQERKRFAAEMHDGLGQSLVIIKNRARLSLKQYDRKDAVLDHLENISATASHAIHEAKEIAFNLRPHLLDRLGLTKAIESMIDKVFSAGEIECDMYVENVDGVLENNSEILLYRIVQECANNIVKHSQGDRAALRLERDPHSLSLRISDNGCGFDTAHSTDLSKRSFGLVGIAERTRLLGGKMSIESSPGHGTVVTVVIGLQSK